MERWWPLLRKSGSDVSSTGPDFRRRQLGTVWTRPVVALEDVAHIVVNSDPRSNLLRKLGVTVVRRPDVKNWFWNAFVMRNSELQSKTNWRWLFLTAISRVKFGGLNNICHICHRHFTYSRLMRPQLYRSMALAIFPVQPGESDNYP